MFVKLVLLCVIIVCVIVEHSASDAESNACAGLNEEWNDCGTACPETCDDYQEQTGCIAMCVPKCQCIEGTVRNRWGNCIPKRKCALENRIRRAQSGNRTRRNITYPKWYAADATQEN